jgi:hypothetical protein
MTPNPGPGLKCLEPLLTTVGMTGRGRRIAVDDVRMNIESASDAPLQSSLQVAELTKDDHLFLALPDLVQRLHQPGHFWGSLKDFFNRRAICLVRVLNQRVRANPSQEMNHAQLRSRIRRGFLAVPGYSPGVECR